MLLRFRPEGRDRKALVARRHQLDRTAEALGCQRDPCRARGHVASRAERAADEPRHGPHVGVAHSELRRDGTLEPPHELGRLIDRQLLAIPGTGGGEQLQRVVVLRRRIVVGLHADRRGGKGGGKVAFLRVRPAAALVLAQLDAGRAERGTGRLGCIGDVDLVRGFPCRLEAVSDDHSDDLTVVPDPVAFQRGRRGPTIGPVRRLDRAAGIRMGEDVEHAWDGFGPVQGHRCDASARDRAGDEEGEGRVGDRFVRGVAGGTRHLGDAVDPRGRATKQHCGIEAHIRFPSCR